MNNNVTRAFAFTTTLHGLVLVGGQNKSINRRCPLWLQVDSMEAVLELCGFVDALHQSVILASEEHWRTERTGLLLQLLCACQRCLGLNGDCRPLLSLMQQLLPSCQQVRLLFYQYLYLPCQHTPKNIICAQSDHYCVLPIIVFAGAAVGRAIDGRGPAPSWGPCSSAEQAAQSG